MESTKAKVTSQYEAIMLIPGITFSHWPAFFTFSLVEYLESMVISVIPPVAGMSGTILASGIRGMTRVVNHATWQAVTMASPSM